MPGITWMPRCNVPTRRSTAPSAPGVTAARRRGMSAMPELCCAGRRWQVAAASNLLDALIQGGVPVPSGCRAGSCHACLVRCLEGEPHDLQPDLLRPEQRHAGWRLACQCRVEGDLSLEVFDPLRDG